VAHPTRQALLLSGGAAVLGAGVLGGAAPAAPGTPGRPSTICTRSPRASTRS
jgi:hypothetical protein